jgi:cytoskeleton protein RodZ
VTAEQNIPSASTTGGETPGERLRQARESAALSQEDIATKLKLSPRQIAAIESGDLSALPERTFTRGFMRNYARLVGIDPDSLGLDQAMAPAAGAGQLKPTPAPIGEIAREVDHNSFAIGRWLVPVLLIAALAVGVVYFKGNQWFGWDASKLLTSTTPPSLKDAVATKAEPALPPAATTTGSAAARDAAAIATPPTSGAVISPSAPTPAAALEAALAVPLINAAAATAPTALPTVGQKRISLTFKGKSWTEVRSSGEVIFSETATPGTREFNGAPPLSFTVGNASNVTVVIDGKPFDMNELTRNDVARFRIE